MSTKTFIGRSITAIEPPGAENDWQWLLRLDDGTAIEFGVRDYGDEITVTHLTPEVLQQRALDREAERLESEAERIRRALAAERRRVHMDEMRGQLDPATFEKWRRETYPTTTEVIKDAWSSAPLAEQFAAPSVLSRFAPPT